MLIQDDRDLQKFLRTCQIEEKEIKREWWNLPRFTVDFCIYSVWPRREAGAQWIQGVFTC